MAEQEHIHQIDPDDEIDFIPEALHQYWVALIRESETSPLAEYQRLAEPDRRGSKWESELFAYSFPQTVECHYATPVKPKGQARGNPELPRGLTVLPENRIGLLYAENEIPHGLAWLVIKEANGTVTLFLPKLEHNSEHKVWWKIQSLDEILKDRFRDVKSVHLSAVPLTDENAAAFDSEQVRQFVTDLEPYTEQGRRAKQYFSKED